MSAGLIFAGAAETIGFVGVFLMASGRAGEVVPGVIAGIPAGPTEVAFGPANLRRGSQVGIS